MARRLFTLLSALSLLLCMATVVLWVRSYYVGDSVLWNPLDPQGHGARWRLYEVMSGTGLLRVQGTTLRAKPYSYLDGWRKPEWRYVREHPNHPTWGSTAPTLADRLGFAYRRSVRWTGDEDDRITFDICVPAWLPVLVFSLMPAAWFTRAWRARKRSNRNGRGLCPSCRYDLRATPGRCPECGTAAAAQKA